MLESNLQALEIGFELAEAVELFKESGLYKVGDLGVNKDERQMLITGNEATALGFAAAGENCWLSYYSFNRSNGMVRTMVAKIRGLVKQTEDEISAINMAIGSALTGTRTMTATCGRE